MLVIQSKAKYCGVEGSCKAWLEISLSTNNLDKVAMRLTAMDNAKSPGKSEENTVDVTSNLYSAPLTAVHSTVEDELERS